MSPQAPTEERTETLTVGQPEPSVLVACPDARPPGYEAVAGLARSGRLARFETSTYYGGYGPLTKFVREMAPCQFARFRRLAKRRHHPEIPRDRVSMAPGVDLCLAAEGRLAGRFPGGRREVARWRTTRFDLRVSRAIERTKPDVALLFSDVASVHGWPTCRRLGVRSILSMVHGDVREEQEILRREAELSPEFFPIYLGDGKLDLDELAWLHDRRLSDLEGADRIFVPSDHIARTLARHGTPEERIRVIPYAADLRRFRPDLEKRTGEGCTFLFAGGITQRKGIGYLLQAWDEIRRPGWKLQLLGPLPARTGPLEPYLDRVELLGRLGHSEVAAKMAAADVFVFPSLFEGSAVVTYEAMACGLPSVLTAEAGSVVRDGVEGLVVPPADVDSLAASMHRMGEDVDARLRMGEAARSRAEQFDWSRYQASINAEIDGLLAG
ncbi:glycosyltransferase family 4 protein [Isosphaeraceae bacterium EP7]